MKITLVPYAGLCNRLNAIASALEYSRIHTEDEIKILWFKYYHCNCRFSDLFKPIPNTNIRVKENYSLIKDRPNTKFNLGIPGLFRRFWYDLELKPGYNADLFDELTKGKKSIFIYKDNRICKQEITKSMAKLFIPTEEIQERIDNITKAWDNSKNVIGVHIRRTDNQLSIKNSPIQHFYQVMDDELKKDVGTIFYLATDDQSVKEDLTNRYGKKIVTLDLTLKRDSLQGMKDAVVDLFCLGKTCKIYGSVASSYSRFASRLYDIPLIH